MKALVTGASGFIGGAVARALLAQGVGVRALLRAGAAPNVDPRTRGALDLRPGDLRDPDAVRRAVRGCDVVFHVGALYSLSARPDELRAVNVGGTRHVLEAAVAEGVSRVVHTSSVSTVGLRPGAFADESVHPVPARLAGPYKRSKWEAERLVDEHVARGLDVVVVNPTFPVGAGDVKPTPTGRVLLDFIDGRLPAFVDTGMNVVDVDDVAAGHLLAWKRGRKGERYLLGHRNMTLHELLAETGRVVGRRPPRVRLPHAAAAVLAWADRIIEGSLLGRPPRIPLEGVRTARSRAFVDCGKAVRELGLPQTPIPEALEKAIGWFDTHGYRARRPPR